MKVCKDILPSPEDRIDRGPGSYRYNKYTTFVSGISQPVIFIWISKFDIYISVFFHDWEQC